MKRLTVFDFDGTLTTSDSMIGIILYHKGRLGLAWALLRQVHLIILMFMGLYDNQRCKERLLAYCFGGMTEEAFEELCRKFAETHRNLLRKDILAIYEKAENKAVISASPVQWVGKFVDGMVVASRMEVIDGRITGRLIGRNCYGKEKVNRLTEAFPDLLSHRNEYHITAYGDSKGDRELLAFADESHLIKR